MPKMKLTATLLVSLTLAMPAQLGEQGKPVNTNSAPADIPAGPAAPVVPGDIPGGRPPVFDTVPEDVDTTESDKIEMADPSIPVPDTDKLVAEALAIRTDNIAKSISNGQNYNIEVITEDGKRITQKGTGKCESVCSQATVEPDVIMGVNSSAPGGMVCVMPGLENKGDTIPETEAPVDSKPQALEMGAGSVKPELTKREVTPNSDNCLCVGSIAGPEGKYFTCSAIVDVNNPVISGDKEIGDDEIPDLEGLDSFEEVADEPTMKNKSV